VICHEQYVSQAKNKFSKRWSSHYGYWKRPDCKNDKDDVALLRHYSVGMDQYIGQYLGFTNISVLAKIDDFIDFSRC